jgi:hypothetical protein
VAACAVLFALALAGTVYALMSNGDGSGQDAGGLQVKVGVAGSQTTYAGQCPVPSAEAPTFTATFSVNRLPASVSYRWVTENGSLIDGGWRTLSFPDGGDSIKQETVRLTSWAKAGTFESGISVQLKAPLQGTSDVVPVSLTCGQ